MSFGDWVGETNTGFRLPPSARVLNGTTRLVDGDCDVSRGPAALESTSTVSGCVVGHHLQRVFARNAEGRRNGCLAGEGGFRRHCPIDLFKRWFGIRELDRSWSSEHSPGQRYRRFGSAGAGRNNAIVGSPDCQRERLV